MERSEFLKLISAGSVLACAGCLGSCSEEDPAPSNIDFTLDLTQPANSALQSVNGAVVREKVIVVRLTTTDFTAVSVTCTHQQTAVNYVPSQQIFHCANHDSRFDKNGNVLNGPATKKLRQYNTALDGNNLRVFS